MAGRAESEDLASLLADALRPRFGPGTRVAEVRKLSGGASRQTISFDVVGADGAANGATEALILRRDPPGVREPEDGADVIGHRLGRTHEGQVLQAAAAAGARVPEVVALLDRSSPLGEGIIMRRIEGEALGHRIVRRPDLARARAGLARQCGRELALIHALPTDGLAFLAAMPADAHLEHYRRILHRLGAVEPGLEYGFRWLAERLELAGGRKCLVHGDFRNGNLIVGPDGLRAVLDWEIAHVGNPLCDLGWICIRSWRYGVTGKRVGGFGDVDELLAGYQEAGGPAVAPEALEWWEIFGCLRWAVMCNMMGFGHLGGDYVSVERAAIGRRSAETEYDLFKLLAVAEAGLEKGRAPCP